MRLFFRQNLNRAGISIRGFIEGYPHNDVPECNHTWQIWPITAAGCCPEWCFHVQAFVHFADPAMCNAAKEAIHGRLFAGVPLQATFAGEAEFQLAKTEIPSARNLA